MKKVVIIFLIGILLSASFIMTSITCGSQINKTSAFSESINKADNQFSELKIKLLMKIANIPSLSACIIKNQSMIIYKGYGYADVLKRQEPTKDTIYQVGSITKSVTATAMMQLIENESYNVSLDNDINDYLSFSVRNPNYPDTPITFRMLLAHQSSLNGISDEIKLRYLRYGLLCSFPYGDNFIKLPEYPYPWIKEYISPDGSLYRESPWLDARPGDVPCYSNINTILIEHLIERLTNQSFEKYCEENIFYPLRMFNTSFHFSEHDRNQLAKPYLICTFGIYLRFPDYDFATGAAGLRTSVEDLSHFLIAHMNGGVYDGTRILEEDTVTEMHRVQYPDSFADSSKWYYGLGWRVSSEKWDNMVIGGHGGNIIGGSGQMDMSNQFGMITIMNRFSFGLQGWALSQIKIELYKLYE